MLIVCGFWCVGKAKQGRQKKQSKRRKAQGSDGETEAAGTEVVTSISGEPGSSKPKQPSSKAADVVNEINKKAFYRSTSEPFLLNVNLHEDPPIDLATRPFVDRRVNELYRNFEAGTLSTTVFVSCLADIIIRSHEGCCYRH